MCAETEPDFTMARVLKKSNHETEIEELRDKESESWKNWINFALSWEDTNDDITWHKNTYKIDEKSLFAASPLEWNILIPINK